MEISPQIRTGWTVAVFVLTTVVWSSIAVSKTPAYYQKKETWFETMMASVRAGGTKADIRALEAAVKADFPAIEDVRQLMLETHAGIWDPRSPEPNLTGMAKRYAGACKGKPPQLGKITSLADVAKVRNAFYRSRLAETIALAERTLEYIEKSTPCKGTAAEIAALKKQVAAAGTDTDCAGLYAAICRTRRQILFAHPALRFKKLLINKHAPGAYSHSCDQYLGRHSRPGQGLVVLENWQTAPKAKRLLPDGRLLPGDVAHPNLSFDGKEVIFGFCDHRTKDRRFWIYEVNADGTGLTQLTGTAKDPKQGVGGRKTVKIEDFDPCYLPDGGFVFTSTRSQCFGRCHGGRYTPSYLLYRADGDGSNIRSISPGEANEHFPSVLNDGRIVFTRWEYINRNQIALHKLWWCRPDGTQISNFYGSSSATPWANMYSDYGREKKWYKHMGAEALKRILPYMITETRAIPGSPKVVATAQGHHSYTAGCLVLIDPTKGEEGFEPISKLTPETPHGEAEDYFRALGNYMTPYPVNEELFFAGYSPFYIPKQGQKVPVNDYMVYLVDTLGGREPIYTDPVISCVSPIPMIPRKKPPVIPSQLAKTSATEKTGTLIVQNVYLTRNDPEKKIKPGSIKHLRVMQVLTLPQSKHAFCGSREDFARKVLGIVPVNPDGSVIFKVPAGIPIHLQSLDENGMAVLTERSLFHVMPGEVRSCVGCHEPVGTTPPTTSATIRHSSCKGCSLSTE